MKNFFIIAVIFALSSTLFSCHDKTQPNYQYMPNMYEAVSYETYAESDAFKSNKGLKGKEGQLPAVGSIKRGYVPYEFANTTEGYDAAKATLKSPLDSLSNDEKKGEELFNIYCAICHGEKGNGKGNLVVREKILGVPSYADREITEGSIFHVMTYGINSMGSYSSQLTQTERWQVAKHVVKLKSEL
jgi:mono/diheme cytochrome c family protein